MQDRVLFEACSLADNLTCLDKDLPSPCCLLLRKTDPLFSILLQKLALSFISGRFPVSRPHELCKLEPSVVHCEQVLLLVALEMTADSLDGANPRLDRAC